MKECQEDDCFNAATRRGLCQTHYMRKWRSQKKAQQPLNPSKPPFRDVLGNKLCQVCKEFLPESEFWADCTNPDGLCKRCKGCQYGMTSRKVRELRDRMLKLQAGICLICHRAITGNEYGDQAALDHDHDCCPGRNQCGKCARGVLCNECNVGLGKFMDSSSLLRNAFIYLKSHGK